MFNGVPLSEKEYARLKKYQRNKGIGNALSRRFRSAMAKVIERTPAAESPREKQIFLGAKEIGYLLAMSEMELWWNIHNVKDQSKAADAKTKKYEKKYADMDEVYLRLIGRKTGHEQRDKNTEKIYNRLSKMGKPYSDEKVQEEFARAFGIEIDRLKQIARKRKWPKPSEN